MRITKLATSDRVRGSCMPACMRAYTNRVAAGLIEHGAHHLVSQLEL
jgi:hypothetical protein